MKTCTTCNSEKPLFEFNKAPRNKDGYQYECRSCRNEGKRRKRRELKANPAMPPAAKVCPRCNLEKPGTAFARDLGAHSGIGGWCKACQNAKRLHDRKSDPVRYKMRTMLNCARGRAKAEHLPFNLTLDWLMETFGAATHCPVLGHELNWTGTSIGPTPWSPSLDEVVLGKGYVKGNVTLMSHKANAMKSNATDAQLISFAHYHLDRLQHLGEHMLDVRPAQTFEQR